MEDPAVDSLYKKDLELLHLEEIIVLHLKTLAGSATAQASQDVTNVASEIKSQQEQYVLTKREFHKTTTTVAAPQKRQLTLSQRLRRHDSPGHQTTQSQLAAIFEVLVTVSLPLNIFQCCNRIFYVLRPSIVFDLKNMCCACKMQTSTCTINTSERKSTAFCRYR